MRRFRLPISMSLTRGAYGLVLLIVMSVLSVAPSNAPVFIVLACFIALMIINVPIAFFAVKDLIIRREHPTHVKEGSDIVVRLLVTNRTSRSRILLRFFDDGPGSGKSEPVMIPMLPPKTRKEVFYTTKAGSRGVYSFDSCVVESSSPFGLVCARKKADARSHIVVYPLYYELRGALFPFCKSYSGMTAAPGSRIGEGPTFFGLREYQRGDPIRKIHWPSTVRTQTVMVKEFEEDMHSSVAILLDNCRDSLIHRNGDSNLEVAVRTAASLANFTLTSGHPTTLEYFDSATDTIRCDEAMGDLTPLLDGLARLNPTKLSASRLLASRTNGTMRYSNWIVVLLSVDRDAITEVLKARSRGIDVVLIIVDWAGDLFRSDSEQWMRPLLTMLDGAGVNLISIKHGDDIQECLSRNLCAPSNGVLFKMAGLRSRAQTG